LNRNISAANIDVCANACMGDVRCDGIVYNDDTNKCFTYQTGDCASNPNSPTCGKITSPSDAPDMYATKMVEAKGVEGGRFKTTNGDNGTCEGYLYCRKNWNNELPDSWGGADCVDSIAVYEDGSEVQLTCSQLPARKHPQTGSKLKHMKVKCVQENGRGWAYKEPAGSPLYNSDCNVPENVRILLGAQANNGIKQGVCDCNNYTWKKNYGGAELATKYAADWKGAKAAYAKTYNPASGTVSAAGGWGNEPVNRATSVSGNGPPLACYVVRDDNNPFIDKPNQKCASNETNYQCVIL
jgi:hypothetical protein